MKMVFKELVKSKRAIFFSILTIILTVGSSIVLMRFSVLVPMVFEGEVEIWRIAVVLAIGIVLDSLHTLIQSKPQRAFYTDTFNRYSEKLLYAHYGFFMENSVARLTTVQNHIQTMANVITQCISLISDLVLLGSVVVTLYILCDWVLFLILAVYVIMACTLKPFYKKHKTLSKKWKVAVSSRNQLFENIINGFTEVRLGSMQSVYKEKFHEENGTIYKIGNERSTINSWMTVLGASADAAASIIAIYYLVSMIADGLISVGMGVTVVGLVGKMINFVMRILDSSDIFGQVAGFKDEWERIMSYQEAEDTGDIEFDEMHQGISVQDVSFSYKQSDTVLHHVDMEIKAGQKIGICGRSGDGKTTLFKILQKFYCPQEGQVVVDGIPLSQIKTDDWYRQIGVVSQNIMIFPTSILENIRWMKPSATEYEVVEAAKKADLYDFVTHLKDGFQTEVGPRGLTLSGGQCQRIALARLFLVNPSIILLDEATSALDNETERYIQSVIDQMKDKTVIIIAHRLSTIQKCDKIFVMDRGYIREQGTHEQLIAIGGIYANMQGKER